MRALVIGQGSIGRRHSRLLTDMGCDVVVVTSGLSAEGRVYSDLAKALSTEAPEYVVIANATASHYGSLAILAESSFEGKILVEKPLFEVRRQLPPNRFARIGVGYNLRFNPVLVELKRRLCGRKVLSVEAYAGQRLPDWRPEVDYRTSYSANAAQGGGVLRDLSHELDIIGWLFGAWVLVAAIGGRRGDLEIDSDDLWAIMMELETGAAVTVQLNYLDRPGRRRFVVVTPNTTFVADISAGTLTENGQTTIYQVERDDTYRAEHAAMFIDGPSEICSVAEANAVLTTIESIEQAASQRSIIMRRAELT